MTYRGWWHTTKRQPIPRKETISAAEFVRANLALHRAMQQEGQMPQKFVQGDVVRRVRNFGNDLRPNVDYVVTHVIGTGIGLVGHRGIWTAEYFELASVVTGKPVPKPAQKEYPPGSLTPRFGNEYSKSHAGIMTTNGCCGLAEMYGVQYHGEPREYFLRLAWAQDPLNGIPVFNAFDTDNQNYIYRRTSYSLQQGQFVLAWASEYHLADQFKAYIEEHKLGSTTSISERGNNRNSGNDIIAFIFTPDRDAFLDHLWSLRE